MKTAIVTGTSGGIGYEVALKLALEGCLVFAVSRKAESFAQLKLADTTNSILPIEADIATEEGLQHIYNTVSAHAQQLHIIVNNAAQLINKPFKTTTGTDFTQLFHVNVVAPAMLLKACMPLLSVVKGAHVVNIGSMAGVQGSLKYAGISAYSASKAALANLTECLAEELRDDNISINCLALGAVQTKMLQASIPEVHTTQTAESMANYIAWFAINGHRYFNGKVLPVATSTP